LKGVPVENFEKGKVYVLEFWATWCKGCKAAMPHLSDLARQYKDQVIVLGVDVYEDNKVSIEKIKHFVDSMGTRMDYRVATQDSNYMVTGWLEAAQNREGIPITFVVDQEGRIAWLGYPWHLAPVLSKLVAGSWDINNALVERNLNRRLNALDDSIRYELMNFNGNPDKPHDLGKPDSALTLINKIVLEEPRLQYAPGIAFYTFSALLKTNPHKAYEYGKKVLVTSTYEDPSDLAIWGPIAAWSERLKLPAEIYELGAEAFQVKINQIVYPEIVDIASIYRKMANMYLLAGNKTKAQYARQKAVESEKVLSLRRQ